MQNTLSEQQKINDEKIEKYEDELDDKEEEIELFKKRLGQVQQTQAEFINTHETMLGQKQMIIDHLNGDLEKLKVKV